MDFVRQQTKGTLQRQHDGDRGDRGGRGEWLVRSPRQTFVAGSRWGPWRIKPPQKANKARPEAVVCDCLVAPVFIHSLLLFCFRVAFYRTETSKRVKMALQGLLHITDFKGSPFLANLVPAASAALAPQILIGAIGVARQSETFYDLAGGVSHLLTLAASIFVPKLRTRLAASSGKHNESILDILRECIRECNWRQLAVTGGVSLWSIRCMSAPSFFCHPMLLASRHPICPNVKCKSVRNTYTTTSSGHLSLPPSPESRKRLPLQPRSA